MLAQPKKREIDHRTLKLLVGLMAISLGGVTSFFAQSPLTSISASYHEGGWPQTFLVGFLFAIAAFLLAYNGESKPEMVLAKIAAVAALGVAMFPCRCGDHTEVLPYVHAASAMAMFLVLAYFCFIFFRRAQAKGHTEAKRRELVYAICGVAILAAILVMALDRLTGNSLSAAVPRLDFYAETSALFAFGVSWLTASRTLPWLTRNDERFSPLSEREAKE
jgi:hypothetical protein